MSNDPHFIRQQATLVLV